MPLESRDDGIHRVTENRAGSSTERVANFTLEFTATVDGDKNALKRGPGFLALVKRFPDGVEK